MARKPANRGPKLDALLDEREHLRVKVRSAEGDRSVEVVQLRSRIVELDREITKLWGGG